MLVFLVLANASLMHLLDGMWIIYLYARHICTRLRETSANASKKHIAQCAMKMCVELSLSSRLDSSLSAQHACLFLVFKLHLMYWRCMFVGNKVTFHGAAKSPLREYRCIWYMDYNIKTRIELRTDSFGSTMHFTLHRHSHANPSGVSFKTVCSLYTFYLPNEVTHHTYQANTRAHRH